MWQTTMHSREKPDGTAITASIEAGKKETETAGTEAEKPDGKTAADTIITTATDTTITADTTGLIKTAITATEESHRAKPPGFSVRGRVSTERKIAIITTTVG